MLLRNKTRLNSWKQIASYLERDVHTARRWEKEKGLVSRIREVRTQLESAGAAPQTASADEMVLGWLMRQR